MYGQLQKHFPLKGNIMVIHCHHSTNPSSVASSAPDFAALQDAIVLRCHFSLDLRERALSGKETHVQLCREDIN